MAVRFKRVTTQTVLKDNAAAGGPRRPSNPEGRTLTPTPGGMETLYVDLLLAVFQYFSTTKNKIKMIFLRRFLRSDRSDISRNHR